MSPTVTDSRPRSWVLIGSPETTAAYAATHTWLGEDVITVTDAPTLRALDPLGIAGIVLVHAETLPGPEATAIETELDQLTALWSAIGVTRVTEPAQPV